MFAHYDGAIRFPRRTRAARPGFDGLEMRCLLSTMSIASLLTLAPALATSAVVRTRLQDVALDQNQALPETLSVPVAAGAKPILFLGLDLPSQAVSSIVDLQRRLRFGLKEKIEPVLKGTKVQFDNLIWFHSASSLHISLVRYSSSVSSDVVKSSKNLATLRGAIQDDVALFKHTSSYYKNNLNLADKIRGLKLTIYSDQGLPQWIVLEYPARINTLDELAGDLAGQMGQLYHGSPQQDDAKHHFHVSIANINTQALKTLSTKRQTQVENAIRSVVGQSSGWNIPCSSFKVRDFKMGLKVRESAKAGVLTYAEKGTWSLSPR